MPLPFVGGGVDLTISGGYAVSVVPLQPGAMQIRYDPTDQSVWYALDDFDGGIPTTAVLGVTPTGNLGRLGWTLNTIGAAPVAVLQSAVSQHPGVLRVSTTAVAGQGGSLALGESASANPLFSGIDTLSGWGFKYIFRLTGSGGQRFYAGLLNQVNIENPANYLGVRYDTTASAGAASAFAFVAVNANISTVVSIAPFTSGWHTAYIYSINSGAVLCQFDAQSVASLGTNIPTVGVTPAITLVTASGVSKTMFVDFFAGLMPGLTRA